MSRKKSRRHKGSNRQVKYGYSAVGAQQLAEMREQDKAWEAERERSPAEKAIEFWRGVEHRPLFVYFITEARTYYDHVDIYTEDERDDIYDQGGLPTGALKAVKIGKAFDPLQRLRELGCGNPRTLILEQVILANERTERRLHQHWGGAGIKGEWYGNRYYDAILATAAVISEEQIRAHKAGENMHYVTELLPFDVVTNRHGQWQHA
jgi:hypothetical protein